MEKEEIRRKIINSTNQINHANAVIARNYNRINALQREIEELRVAKKSVKKVLNKLENGKSDTNSLINAVPGLSFIASSVLKTNLFRGVMDVINGNKYASANNSVNNSLRKIDDEIRKKNMEIDSLKSEISASQSNINRYTKNKNYYSSLMREKGKKKWVHN